MAPSAAAAPSAARGSGVREDGKVVVQFRHAGDAPILKQAKFKVPATARFQVVTQLLRSHLHLETDDPLVRRAPPPRAARAAAHRPRARRQFLYCNSAFAPPPDELVADVAACFHVDNVLVLNYCTTPAWG